MLAFAQTYVNVVGFGFFSNSKNRGEVTYKDFAPSKSAIWPEIIEMIKLLEKIGFKDTFKGD